MSCLMPYASCLVESRLISDIQPSTSSPSMGKDSPPTPSAHQPQPQPSAISHRTSDIGHRIQSTSYSRASSSTPIVHEQQSNQSLAVATSPPGLFPFCSSFVPRSFWPKKSKDWTTMFLESRCILPCRMMVNKSTLPCDLTADSRHLPRHLCMVGTILSAFSLPRKAIAHWHRWSCPFNKGPSGTPENLFAAWVLRCCFLDKNPP